ncbi:Polysaccharide deacetylase family protein [Candidatus Hydrogenisulfobacillus filiaventi]|uniref:Polysaccharide deacetylase family protein n=1 Tax=Candidatus Hydrogenisulfobacillus filiaventi TaxID=2707344 RepID=A0A6F8ZF88_9FIRM|nr:polysaccharide deacetylase family protein [Bacillota bacterium]CAB1128330.1 Polysaccharide deacetylase family protein [Candidatus Hydrogenisulfobacillus filiaventi]
MLAAVVALVVALVTGYFLAPDLLWHHAQIGALAGDPLQPRVALTFDDGPGTDTAAVLDRLKEAGVHATFFLVAEEAARRPDLARRIAAEGHDIGLHGYRHRSSYLLGPWATWQEVRRGTRALTAITGIRPRYYRPPWGHHNLITVAAARAQGLTRVMWSVAPDDWRRDRTAEGIAARVVRLALPGSIVVLHDGGGDRRQTVAALPRLIAGLRAIGIEPGPVSALTPEPSYLQRAWAWWEIRFTQRWQVDTVPTGGHGLSAIRIGRARYHGPRLELPAASGPVHLAPGAWFGEIHLGNAALARFSDDPRKAGVRALGLMLNGLKNLARYLDQNPEYTGITAVGGLTVLNAGRAVEQLGFTVRPAREWWVLPMWLYLLLLLAIYHRQGWRAFHRAGHLKPIWALMSVEELQRRYGARKGGRRTPAADPEA